MFCGENDFAFCEGNCVGTYNVSSIAELYPNAADVSVYLQPNTGHVLELSINATGSYQVMWDYLSEYGL